MKSSQLYRILLNNGWVKIKQKGSHVKLRHPKNSEIIIFPAHGSQEVGSGLEKKILKQAKIKK